LGKLTSKPSAAREPLDQHQILSRVSEQYWGDKEVELGEVGA